MAQIYQQTKTVARLNGKTYNLFMTQEPDKLLEKTCDEYRKIDRNIYGYYFLCNDKEYKEHKQAMIDKIQLETHNKRYNILDNSEKDIDIDDLNDDLVIDNYLNEQDNKD